MVTLPAKSTRVSRQAAGSALDVANYDCHVFRYVTTDRVCFAMLAPPQGYAGFRGHDIFLKLIFWNAPSCVNETDVVALVNLICLFPNSALLLRVVRVTKTYKAIESVFLYFRGLDRCQSTF